MRTSALLPALLIAASAHGATFTLATNFDSTNDDTLTAPYVGTLQVTYTAGSALTDGSYKWTDLNDASMLAQFTYDSATYSFTEAHVSNGMEIDNLYLQVVGTAFYFKMSDGEPTWFTNNGFTFTTEPIDLDSFSTHRQGNFDYALYQFGATNPETGYVLAPSIYFGNYGASTVSGRETGLGGGAIPEPSTYGLILGGLALAGAAIRRRRKA
jgi:hypothetical protein